MAILPKHDLSSCAVTLRGTRLPHVAVQHTLVDQLAPKLFLEHLPQPCCTHSARVKCRGQQAPCIVHSPCLCRCSQQHGVAHAIQHHAVGCEAVGGVQAAAVSLLGERGCRVGDGTGTSGSHWGHDARRCRRILPTRPAIAITAALLREAALALLSLLASLFIGTQLGHSTHAACHLDCFPHGCSPHDVGHVLEVESAAEHIPQLRLRHELRERAGELQMRHRTADTLARVGKSDASQQRARMAARNHTA